MHLWPSVRIRDSFKIAYLRKLEWNLHRMKSEKQSSSSSSSSSPRTPSNQQKLLNGQEAPDSESASCNSSSSFILICRGIFMVLSCCFCCFCCGDAKIQFRGGVHT
ncbi:hypothetical protein REPUB_Repub03eG0187800 [Reevesia pubescens]